MAIEDLLRASVRRHRIAAIVVLLLLVAAGCRADATVPGASDSPTDSSPGGAADSGAEAAQPDDRPSAPPSDLPRSLSISDIDCSLPGQDGSPSALTPQGEEMFDRYLATGVSVPTYQLAVDVNPMTGELSGALRAHIPAQQDTIDFRVFAGLDAFDSSLRLGEVRIDGAPVDYVLDQALLTVPVTPVEDRGTTVELSFAYTIGQMAANTSIFGALSGETLQPDQVGLLGRTPSGMQLGHWFPVWLPDGIRTDADPAGFGDIGAFPAADICATITVPAGYEVITGGVRSATTTTSIVEAGRGLRDFSILISDNLTLVSGVVEGVQINVWGPPSDTDALTTVLGHARESQQALTDAFGPYPWQAIDLVSAPLGAGVGGMEWPGMIWVETSIFGGGLPGMGEFEGLFGDDNFAEMLANIGGPALSTTLEWTVAHELGHEWWHATVGNDSIASPAIDEPLAQFAACIAMQRIHPDNWRAICEAQTTEQFAQARSLGVNDTAAEQASDEFESALQYGAVVYGKAPGFYLAAADLIGWDELTAALNSFVAENPFALVSTDALRSHLISEAGANGPAIGDLWDRWFREAKGDEDIEASNIFGSFGGAGSPEIEGLDLENLDIEGLDLEGLDLENLDLDELFGEDSDLLQELLEDLLDE